MYPFNQYFNARLQKYRDDFRAGRTLPNRHIRRLANAVNMVTKKRVVSPHWLVKSSRVRDYGSRDSIRGKTQFVYKYIDEYTDQVFTDRQLAHIFDYDNGGPTDAKKPDDCDFHPLTVENMRMCEGFKFTLKSYIKLFPDNPYGIPENTKRLIIVLPSEMDNVEHIYNFLRQLYEYETSLIRIL